MENGAVIALDRTSGVRLWTRCIAKTSADSALNPGITLRADGGIAVAQIGSGRLVALRVLDGRKCWAVGDQNSTDDSDGVNIQDGVVYALLSSNKLLALEAATGRVLWKRRSSDGPGSSSKGVRVVGDLVITRPGSRAVAVSRRDGRTAWFVPEEPDGFKNASPEALPWRTDEGDRKIETALFEIQGELAIVDGRKCKLRSVWGDVSTLVVRDPATGHERWRWQPNEAYSFDQITSDGSRLFVSDGRDIRAVEDGEPPPLPADRAARTRLARRAVFSLTGWSDPKCPMQAPTASPGAFRSQTEGPFEFLRHAGDLLHGPDINQYNLPGNNEAALTLMRLHADGVRVLMDYVSHETATKANEYNLTEALDLLFQSEDRSIYPGLIRLLHQSTDRTARKLLAGC
jgi:hypothetical protein